MEKGKSSSCERGGLLPRVNLSKEEEEDDVSGVLKFFKKIPIRDMYDCLNFAPQFSLEIRKLGFVAKCLVPDPKRNSFGVKNSVRNRNAIPFPSDDFGEVMEKGNVGEIRLERVGNGSSDIDALEMAEPSPESREDVSSGEIRARNKSIYLERDSRSRRRQMRTRRSDVMAKQVISIRSALGLGFVSQLWVDASSWIVMVVEVKPSLLSGDFERFLVKEIKQVGDVILVEDENVIDDIKFVGLETLVGYNVVTQNRQIIGKVRGYNFNINSGAVEFLELDSFGVSIIPTSLVSTYALFVEDVMEVSSDTVVVHEARVHRLTKGLWDGQKNAASVFSNINDHQFEEKPRDPVVDYSNTERQRRKSSEGGKPGRCPKTRRHTTSADDLELELPMDYL